MISTLATIISISALVTAAPTTTRQEPQIPDTVYGVDPSKPFYLSAYTTDGTSSYTLQPFFSNYLEGILGLQAILEGGTTDISSPQANFTLAGNHYGTQLYAYSQGPCTSAASCDSSLLQWSNDEPSSNSLLTFHQGVDEPTFGGLALFGKYAGGDFEAAEEDYLIGEDDTDFTKAFAVCDWVVNPEIQVVVYHGTNSSCVPVIVTASQVPGF